jgi:hypothetical protein
MIEVLKQAYQLLLTEPHAPTVCDQLEVIFRRAIAELESQEPVAWADHGVVNWIADKQIKHASLLYTHPPQRTWVGLTDDEVEGYWDWEDFQTGAGRLTIFEMVRDIEAKLKEKNI